jgi:hypothetical protein
MIRRLAIAAMAVLLVGTLNGCSLSVGDDAYCVPLVKVAPRHAHPGGRIKVWTNDRCRAPVPTGGWVIGAAPDGAGADPVVSVTVHPRADGRFSTTLELPADMAAGDAHAGIWNWDYSRCKDTGASCAGPMGSFRVASH